MSNRIRIANPPAGHSGFVGMKHAERWVKQGKAEWSLNGDLRLSSAFRYASMRGLSPSGDESGVGYDEVRREMNSREKANIPLLKPRR